mgnify:CR=1 FL=1
MGGVVTRSRSSLVYWVLGLTAVGALAVCVLRDDCTLLTPDQRAFRLFEAEGDPGGVHRRERDEAHPDSLHVGGGDRAGDEEGQGPQENSQGDPGVDGHD